MRFRWLVHRLSVELFGRSMPLQDFPTDKTVRGIGLTDPHCIAAVLAERFDYRNTFLTSEPRFDIRSDPSPLGELDFLIASEVFEHVEPPVERAFENAARLLRPSGLLLLTVPWVWDGDSESAIPELYDWYLTSEADGYAIVNHRADGVEERFRHMAFDGSAGPSLGRTREHFPRLHNWRIEATSGGHEVINRLPDGSTEIFRHPVFHDGPGLALEMRLFTKIGIERNLVEAGFDQIQFETRECRQLGIVFGHPWSRPVAARSSVKGL